MNEQKIAFFIDDDPNFLVLIPDVIQHPRFKIQTFCAVNGYKAIDEIIKVKPDVLFIDFYLPRANGGQILPILKSVQALSNLPVYFLTGYSKEEILPLLKDTNVKDADYDGILLKSDSLPGEVLEILNHLDDGASI